MKMFIAHGSSRSVPYNRYDLATNIDDAIRLGNEMMGEIEKAQDPCAVDWNAECGLETGQLLYEGEQVEFVNELVEGDVVCITPVEV